MRKINFNFTVIFLSLIPKGLAYQLIFFFLHERSVMTAFLSEHETCVGKQIRAA